MNGIMVELILWSNNPDLLMQEIEKTIKMQAISLEVMGDIKKYGEKKELTRMIDVSSLTYSTKYVDTIDVEKAIAVMLEMIEPSLEVISEIVKVNSLNAKFCIVINSSEQPIMSIPSKFIQVMSRLSASLEFDMYIETNKKHWFWRKKR